MGTSVKWRRAGKPTPLQTLLWKYLARYSIYTIFINIYIYIVFFKNLEALKNQALCGDVTSTTLWSPLLYIPLKIALYHHSYFLRMSLHQTFCRCKHHKGCIVLQAEKSIKKSTCWNFSVIMKVHCCKDVMRSSW